MDNSIIYILIFVLYNEINRDNKRKTEKIRGKIRILRKCTYKLMDIDDYDAFFEC